MKEILKSVKTVMWGFLGVRSSEGLKSDAKNTNPLVLMAVAFMLFLIFILLVFAAAKYASGI